MLRIAVYTVLLIGIGIALVKGQASLPHEEGLQSEKTRFKDMKAQLLAAKKIYEKESGKKPQGFQDFVALTFMQDLKQPYTLSLSKFQGGACRIATEIIYCPGHSKGITQYAEYNWNDGDISLRLADKPDFSN